MILFTGKVAEFDEPANLMKKESLFGKLVKEYWSYDENSNVYNDQLL